MTSFVLKDALLAYGGFNVSGLANQVAINYGAEMKPSTALGDTTTQRLAGLLDAQVTEQGYWDADFDLDIFNDITNQTNALLTVAGVPSSPVGSRAFMLNGAVASYSIAGQIGEIFPFTFEAQVTNSPLIRGRLFSNATLTASANSPGVNLGSVPAGSTLYAGLHIVGAGESGDTLDISIESDDTSAFDSTATQRGTFTQVGSTVTSELITVAGPVTDTWWRFVYTAALSSGANYDVIAVMGISDK